MTAHRHKGDDTDHTYGPHNAVTGSGTLRIINVDPDAALEMQHLGHGIGRAPLHWYERVTADVENGIVEPDPDADPGLWVRQSAAALAAAAPGAVADLGRLAAANHPVIWVQGLPRESRPVPTPENGRVDWRATRQSIINVLAVLGAISAAPICYMGENHSLLHAVAASLQSTTTLSSQGSRRRLPLHSDYADRAFPGVEAGEGRSPIAKLLSFAIVRGEPGVPMEAVDAAAIAAQLSSAEIELAQTEEFYTRPPAIFRSEAEPILRRILCPDGRGGHLCRLNLGGMTGRSAGAVRLLRRIDEITAEPSLMLRLDVRPGDVVIFNNHRVLHRRAAYQPRFDGRDRFFIRVGGADDVAHGVAADSSRPWVWY